MRKKIPLSMEIPHASAGGNGRRGEVKVTCVDEESEAGKRRYQNNLGLIRVVCTAFIWLLARPQGCTVLATYWNLRAQTITHGSRKFNLVLEPDDERSINEM